MLKELINTSEYQYSLVRDQRKSQEDFVEDIAHQKAVVTQQKHHWQRMVESLDYYPTVDHEAAVMLQQFTARETTLIHILETARNRLDQLQEQAETCFNRHSESQDEWFRRHGTYILWNCTFSEHNLANGRH